jgi:transcriptional regulator with XRE-family HTH domain
VRKFFGKLRVTKSLHTAAYRKLTELLLEARQTAGLTQQEVADRLETHQSYIAKVEKGERRIDVVELVQLARAIGVSSASLTKKIEAVVAAEK